MTELISGRKISELVEITDPSEISDDLLVPVLDVNQRNRRVRVGGILRKVPLANHDQAGIIRLAGDLGGTANSPTVPGLSEKAPLDSPEFTGTPMVPTASFGSETEQAANTEFVQLAIDAAAPSDATAQQRGLVRLTCDLGGTADCPTVPGLECKAPIDSPEFRGSPTAPTPPVGDASTRLATTAFVQRFGTSVPDATTTSKGKIQLAGDLAGTAAAPTVPGLASKAPIDSPHLTGTPTAPSPPVQTVSDQVATTQFVRQAISQYACPRHYIERISGQIEVLRNKNYIVDYQALYRYKIKSLLLKLVTGTCKVTAAINGVAIAELTDVEPENSDTIVTLTEETIVEVGQTLSLLISDVSTAEDLIFRFGLER